jgi:sec-independent protein translocase protein TatA
VPVFGSLGGPEMVVILVLALLIFGPRRLPELGRSLGKGLAELRKASNDLRRTLEQEVRDEGPSTGGDLGAVPAAPPGATPRIENAPPPPERDS